MCIRDSHVPEIFFTNDFYRLTPVSYTHLDVYKRQFYNFETCNNAVTEWTQHLVEPLVFVKNTDSGRLGKSNSKGIHCNKRQLFCFNICSDYKWRPFLVNSVLNF